MTRSIDDFVGIGPYKAGEIPEPYEHVFTDGGTPIWLGEPGTFACEFQFRRDGDTTVVGGTCTIFEQGAEDDTTAENRGKVSYEWVDGDLDTRGLYRGEIWVGDEIERIASDTLIWEVQPVAAPAPDLTPSVS